MSTTEKPHTAPLAHKELDIPGRTGPVTDGPPPVWGINHGAALDNFPLHGLLCRAGPWGQMSTGDQVNIYWGTGQLVLPKTVQAHEVNTELQMFIAPKHLVEGTFAVSYTITRLNQTPEPSEVMHVEVKLTRPGGHDDTEEPGHPHLFMSIPREILESGVDKDNVAAGVDIGIGKADGTAPYPFAAAGDRIQVSWGGVFVPSEPLSQEQAEGKVPIVVHVEECDIDKAGDSDAGGLSVAYEVYDRVYNRSEDWSVAQRVVVAVDTTLLNAPVLKEAVNNVLDVDLLGNADGTAQVVATNSSGKNDFEVGDTVYVRIKGTPQDGGPIDLQLPGFELINVPSIPEIKVPNTVLRQLAKRQIALSYSVKKDEDTVLRAKTQFIDAIGEIQRLAAPVAVEAQQGALDPTLAQVRIDIPFDESFALGQSIELYWHGTTPELKPYLPKLDLRSITLNDIEAKLPLRINVPGPAHLTPINGGTLELYYKLLIDDALLGTMNTLNQTHTVRESIHAQILRVGEPRQELPEPTVAGVVDGVLPPDTDGTTLTATAVDTVAKDEVTYRWVGSKTGEAWDMIVLNSTTAGAPVTFNIKAELIKGNEGGTVSATYEIKRFSGTTSYSNALAFRVGVALENPLPAPQMPEASGTGANVTLAPLSVQNGARVIVAYTGMDETHTIKLSMHGTPGPGSPDIPAKPGVTSGSIEFLIPATAIAANIGNSAKTFTLEYEVTAGTPIPSSPLTVSVTPLPATELDKISIEEAEGAVLDLTKVTAGATVLAGVWAFIAVNHRVKLIITGTKTNGDPLDLIVWPWPSSRVNQNWIDTGRYAYTLAYNAIKDLAHDSRLELHFKAALTSSQVEAEAIDAPVKVYTIKALLDLQPPTLVDAEDPIDVLAYPDGVTVRIEFPDALPGDRVRLVEVNAPAGSPQFPLEDFVDQQVNVVLSAKFLAIRQDRSFELRWNLNRDGEHVASSPHRRVTANKIIEGDVRLPIPVLADENGESLDINSLPENAAITVNKWIFQEINKPLFLKLEGTDSNGNGTQTFIRNGEPHPSADGLTIAAPLEWLRDLKDNSRLSITVGVNPDGVADLAKAVIFPVRAYTVRTKESGVPSFTNAPYTIAPGGRLKDVELLLSSSDGTPIPSEPISLTLPAEFTYADGGNGQRDFITDEAGRICVSGVKGALIAGSYNLSATSGSQTANATVTVKGLGPVGSIPVGDSPGDIAVSPDGTRLYVCIAGEAKVSVIDTATNQVLTNIPAGETPRGIVVSPDGTRAYLCIIRENRVLVIDTATNRVLTDIKVGTDPSSMAVSPDGTRAYCGNFSNKTISVIDTATNLVQANISVGNNPKGVVVSPDGTRAYVCNYDSHTVSVIDTATNLVLTYIPVELRPYNIAVSPDGTRVYVGGYRQTVTVIDTATHLVLTNISVGSDSKSIAISPDGTRLYNAHHELNKVSVIDTVTNRVLTNIPVGGYPSGVAVSPNGTRVYVTNMMSNTISVIDTTTY